MHCTILCFQHFCSCLHGISNSNIYLFIMVVHLEISEQKLHQPEDRAPFSGGGLTFMFRITYNPNE
jgi:hypothetical protein